MSTRRANHAVSFAKKHGLEAWAVYLGNLNGTYLGDVGPWFQSGLGITPKALEHSARIGWWALPAGTSDRLALAFPDRASAARVLADRA